MKKKMSKVIIPWSVSVVAVVLIMPFLTLLERKILSYIQFRKGPNKVSWGGLLQPLTDGFKLMIKESGSKSRVKSSIFWLSSLMKFSFMVVFLVLYVSLFPCYSLNLGIILYLCFSSLIVYTMLSSGWSSKSKFSFLGSLRGGAQIMSYEIALMVMLFFPCVLSFSFKVKVMSTGFSFMNLYMFPIFMMWIISIIAETNRSPFDFAEGESELVSGFKTEYSGMAFALLFLGEYGKMIFLSIFTCMIFFPKLYMFKIIISKIMIFFFLWFRGTFPRFRYDFLMSLAWKGILPISLLMSWILLI